MDVSSLKADIVASIDIQKFYESWMRDVHIRPGSGGWSRRVRCPFHEDSETPNFFVSLGAGTFKCHACQAGGSIFDFWLRVNGKDKSEFMDAVLALANTAGIDISEWKDGKDFKSSVNAERRKAAEMAKPEVHTENTEVEFDKGKPPISRDLAIGFHKSLTADVVSYLTKNRGLTRKTIESCLIGWDGDWVRRDKDGHHALGRITLPVISVSGSIRNIRGYSNQCDHAFKMVNYVENKGEANELSRGKPPRLYNVRRLVEEKWNHVVICEGEFDAILLTQKLHDAGYKDWGAITPTHGVSNFQPWWIDLFEGKNVYLCFDVDSAGKIGAAKTATEYFLPGIKTGKFNSVKIIELPGLAGTKEENDITDFFVSRGYDVKLFIKTVVETPPLITGGVDDDDASVEPIEVDDLVSLLHKREYIDQRIKVPIAIIGQTSKLYHAIRQCEVEYCPNMKSDADCCTNKSQVHTIPYGHTSYISACMNTEKNQERDVGEFICRRGKGHKLKVKSTQKVVVELYFAHQVVNRVKTIEKDGRMVNTNDHELKVAPVYIMQPPEAKSVQPTNYMAIGWVRTHPRTGMASLFVESMELIEDDWFKFDSTLPENIEHLRKLKGVGSNEIVSSIVDNVTRIYEADEILYTVLLTYLSPLRFVFNNELQRGWINSAIVGDTGTGKSATFGKFSDWIGTGNSFSALSGSRTGLLYAIKQSNTGDWQLSVGQYVRSDGQILAIDEVQELDSGEIKKMAIAMDTGHLQVERVVTGGYPTRTRACFILNPKDIRGRASTISDFRHGCESIENCFDEMFMRRLDFAVFSTGNHAPEFYNRRVKEDDASSKEAMPFTADNFRSLVFWTWTRTKDQVKFSSEATDLALQVATKLGVKYGHAEKVPLANPQDLRLKIARISAAFAALNCSFSDDFQELIILPEHVKAAAQFLDIIYSSSSCELSEVSEKSRCSQVLDDYDVVSAAVDEAIKTDAASSSIPGGSNKNFLKLMLMINEAKSIRRNDIQIRLGVKNSWLKAKLSMFMGLRLIEEDRYGVEKTRKWNLFMKKWRSSCPEKYKVMCDLHLDTAMNAARVPDTSTPKSADSGKRGSGDYDSTNEGHYSSYGDPQQGRSHEEPNEFEPNVNEILGAEEPHFIGEEDEDRS